MQRCLERQQVLLQSTEGLIKNELNRFQERLQRCSQICQDEVSDQITPGMDRSSPKFLNIERKVTTCMSGCVDKHISLVQSIHGKLNTDIDELIKKNNNNNNNNY